MIVKPEDLRVGMKLPNGTYITQIVAPHEIEPDADWWEAEVEHPDVGSEEWLFKSGSMTIPDEGIEIVEDEV